MKKYFCNPCGYTYDPEVGDPEHGIAPGTAFEDLPDDWCCPNCGITKDMFQPCIDNYNYTAHRGEQIRDGLFPFLSCAAIRIRYPLADCYMDYSIRFCYN